MTTIRYQFLQVESAYYNDGQLVPDYKTPGNIIFDKKRGTITVVTSGGGWTEYGGGIKGVSKSESGETFTFTDSFGNALELDLSKFATDEDLNTLSNQLSQLGEGYTSLSGRLSSVETTVGNHSTAIADRYTKSEVDNKISALGKVFNFVGVVDTYQDLESKTAKVGDVYQVRQAGLSLDAGVYFANNTEFYYGEFDYYGIQIQNFTAQATVYIEVLYNDMEEGVRYQIRNSNGNPFLSTTSNLPLFVLYTGELSSGYKQVYVEDINGLPVTDVSNCSESSNAGKYKRWDILGVNETDMSKFASKEELQNVKDALSEKANKPSNYEEAGELLKVGTTGQIVGAGIKFVPNVGAATSEDKLTGITTINQTIAMIEEHMCWHTLE